MIKKPFYHFSIDDIFEELLEIENYDDPFSHPFFRYLKSLYERWGVHTTLYTLYSTGEKTLRDVTGKYRNTFSENRWLHFAPHALNYETAPYNQNPEEAQDIFEKTYSEIERFAGKSDAKFVRLHYFSELYELADFFKSKGVTHLFTRDKNDPVSWRLPEKEKKDLEEKGITEFNGIGFIRSHLRIEFAGPNLTEGNPQDVVERVVKSYLEKHNFFTFLTHDIELKGEVEEKTKRYLETILLYLSNKNILSGY